MIYLRKMDGSRVPLPEAQFVELVNDLDQTIGTVFTQSRPGAILQINPGTRDAQRYSGLFPDARFCSALIQRDLRGASA